MIGPMLDRLTEAPTLRAAWPVALFTLVYLVAGAIVAVARSNTEFLMYLVLMLGLIGLVVWLHVRVRFTAIVLWGLSVWGMLHLAGGLVPVPESWPVADDDHVLYDVWLWRDHLKYDQVVHAVGVGAATWVCWRSLQWILRAYHGVTSPVRATWGLIIMCGIAGLGVGALNETAEFAATRMLSDTNVGGYVNTGWDLVANLVGVIAVCGVIRLVHGPSGDQEAAADGASATGR